MPDKNNNALEKSLTALATIASAILSVLITPQVYNYTILWMLNYIAKHYGNLLIHYVELGWFATIALFIFFFLRFQLIMLIKLALARSR